MRARFKINEDGETRLVGEDFTENEKYLVHIKDADFDELVYKTPRQIIDYLDMRDCFEYELYEIPGHYIKTTWKPGVGNKFEIINTETNTVAFWGYGTDH